jgi:hypothetical protein
MDSDAATRSLAGTVSRPTLRIHLLSDVGSATAPTIHSRNNNPMFSL